MEYGYIYIRTNEYWNNYDVYKLGKTCNIIDREQTYITSEIKRGNYVMIIEIELKILDEIEKNLQKYFKELNLQIKYDGGIEFYKKEIINYIIPYFDKNKIKYKILSKDEIDVLIRKVRKEEKKFKYNPRNYQETIIKKSCEYFENNEKGLLIIPCGVGKTLISLWITQRLKINTIIIGVPNKLLLKQWQKVIYDLFENFPCLIVSGGIDIDNIIRFLNMNKKYIIITTYSSSYKVNTAIKNLKFIFGMKINDETHHLTSTNMELEKTTKKYTEMLKIPSIKQLSLTATIKQIENMSDNINVISNDNVKYFGEIIDRKSLLWSINENIICDYIIQTIITDEEQLEQQLLRFNIIDENDKRLFLSAFVSLKSIFEGHSHHLLVYLNNKENSLKLIEYIKMLLDDNYFRMDELYYNNYHSEMKSKKQKEIINNFENAKFGIISCVYCLGEGWDFPLLDGVVFAENMTSNIRIVQSALRASRKDENNINKKNKIILPILNKDDWLENNDNIDLRKVREVIYQMSLEDETIIQKIRVFKINIEKQKPKTKEKEDKKMIDEFGEYDNELTEKLKLKTIKRTALGITYEKAKRIIAEKNIKNKKSYYELCEKDIRLSKEPEIVFKGQFTNWIEYLNIKREYYNLENCKNKVNELISLYPEIKKHYLDLSIVSKKLCEKDELFPPNDLWTEYYNVKDLRDLISITNIKKNMGAII